MNIETIAATIRLRILKYSPLVNLRYGNGMFHTSADYTVTVCLGVPKHECTLGFSELAAEITAALSIPTICIGAGAS
jgi:hypothetical protein